MVEVVLRARKGKPPVGSVVVTLPSGAQGHISLRELAEALMQVGGGGIKSVSPAGGKEVLNIFVNYFSQNRVIIKPQGLHPRKMLIYVIGHRFKYGRFPTSWTP